MLKSNKKMYRFPNLFYLAKIMRDSYGYLFIGQS
uniref:Uncharacterized protein n=1 Tax=Anopheles quadriannulatus TaxID=34691 RepID=A0A182XTS4_ANOQN